MIKRTLGGDRLGSGKKMQVEMHGYDRATFDLSYLFRTTMSMGTLVPFMSLVGLPGDTFDIKLNMEMNTHPTVGPLFGSAKTQADVFVIPMRLYNALIHNNKLNIGLTMNKVFLPVFTLKQAHQDLGVVADPDNSQVNPSCLLKYLGISGIGINETGIDQERDFNAVPLLGYWDTVKNYYSNKQEVLGAVIHNAGAIGVPAVTAVYVENAALSGVALPVPAGVYLGSAAQTTEVQYPSGDLNLAYLIYQTSSGEIYAEDLFTNWVSISGGKKGNFNAAKWGQLDVFAYRLAGASDGVPTAPTVQMFPLSDIDKMRELLLATQSTTAPVNISKDTGFGGLFPYTFLTNTAGSDTVSNRMSSQEGLALKTYQSDLFNNWLQTEFIDGPTGINEITAIDVSGGTLEVNQLILARKVYNLLNRVAVSGGTFDDWLETVYANGKPWVASTPMYVGGLIKELVFQEVVSNSQTGEQPLGTLAGKGRFNDKHKGGHISIKIQEPSYILGLVSITPRVDYSQGNSWDVYALKTFDDLHKPQLDEIGFQDLITEQMAWWGSEIIGPGVGNLVQHSAGKQPAWVNYMTSVNKCFGNFAIRDNEMFMTFNRRYELDLGSTSKFADLTTYIDPVKFNYIFADTALDAQNYWLQMSVGIEARRVMSAKLMPNL